MLQTSIRRLVQAAEPPRRNFDHGSVLLVAVHRPAVVVLGTLPAFHNLDHTLDSCSQLAVGNHRNLDVLAADRIHPVDDILPLQEITINK